MPAYVKRMQSPLHAETEQPRSADACCVSVRGHGSCGHEHTRSTATLELRPIRSRCFEVLTLTVRAASLPQSSYLEGSKYVIQ